MAVPLPLSFDLQFEPSILLVSAVRRFVSFFYEQVFGDGGSTSRIALATHELMENAVKGATDGFTRIRVEVSEASGGQSFIRIATWNRAHPQNREEIVQRLKVMQEHTDPIAYYDSMVAEAAQRQVGSGLGLARVRVEAEMDLRCEIQEDMVVMFAETHTSERRKS